MPASSDILQRWQVLADVAAADAFAAKGASDIDAQQMQAKLRALVADAVKSSSAQPSSLSPPAQAQQAVLRYALARHGKPACLHGHEHAPCSHQTASSGIAKQLLGTLKCRQTK